MGSVEEKKYKNTIINLRRPKNRPNISRLSASTPQKINPTC